MNIGLLLVITADINFRRIRNNSKRIKMINYIERKINYYYIGPNTIYEVINLRLSIVRSQMLTLHLANDQVVISSSVLTLTYFVLIRLSKALIVLVLSLFGDKVEELELVLLTQLFLKFHSFNKHNKYCFD